jgi:hypothetical protein
MHLSAAAPVHLAFPALPEPPVTHIMEQMELFGSCRIVAGDMREIPHES